MQQQLRQQLEAHNVLEGVRGQLYGLVPRPTWGPPGWCAPDKESAAAVQQSFWDIQHVLSFKWFYQPMWVSDMPEIHGTMQPELSQLPV